MVCFAFLQKSIALQDRIFKRNWSKDEKRHSSFFFFFNLLFLLKTLMIERTAGEGKRLYLVLSTIFTHSGTFRHLSAALNLR